MKTARSEAAGVMRKAEKRFRFPSPASRFPFFLGALLLVLAAGALAQSPPRQPAPELPPAQPPLEQQLERELPAGSPARAPEVESITAPPAAPKVDFPDYQAAACCDLCSRAGDARAYNTSFLGSFRMLVQGKDGWLFRTKAEFITQFGPDAANLQRLKRFAAALAKRGVALVVVMQPPRALMQLEQLPASQRRGYNADAARQNYVKMLDQLRSAGVVVPATDRLLGAPGDDPDKAFFFRGDHHWTPEGARRTAEIAAEAIRKMPAYAGVNKARFATERVGLFAKSGTLHKAALIICGYGSPRQWVDRYVTEPVGGGGDNLLGDAPTPQIALAGTSNSGEAYNFAGFLAERLEADVLNTAMDGAGVDGALRNYLPTPEFQKSPPKILIWEVEPYHNLSSERSWQQLIPLVHNGCEGREAVLSRQTQVKAGRTEVLFNGGGKVLPLKSGRYLVDLTLSDPSVRQINVDAWYTNGRADDMEFKMPDYIEHGGRYVFNLRDDPEWKDRTFLSLDLHVPSPPKGLTVNARLCERLDGRPAATVTASAAGA